MHCKYTRHTLYEVHRVCKALLELKIETWNVVEQARDTDGRSYYIAVYIQDGVKIYKREATARRFQHSTGAVDIKELEGVSKKIN